MFSGGSFKGSNVDAGFITAENWIKTPALQVNGIQVLTPTETDNFQSISVTYSDESTDTLTARAHSKVCNINSQQQLLTCQVDLSSLSKAITQIIIPSGLDFTGKRTNTACATVAEINGTDLLLGMVHIYVEATS